MYLLNPNVRSVLMVLCLFVYLSVFLSNELANICLRPELTGAALVGRRAVRLVLFLLFLFVFFFFFCLTSIQRLTITDTNHICALLLPFCRPLPELRTSTPMGETLRAWQAGG